MDRAATSTVTSSRQPRRPASTIMRPSLGSTGSRESRRPVVVTAPDFSRAPSSVSRRTASLTALESGFWTKGKSSSSAGVRVMPIEDICSSTLASEVRRISGSVNSGREPKSSSEYSRMATPGEVRPARPER